jgi:tRNA nucleotidyltransferase (CCA-adding enzyme)
VSKERIGIEITKMMQKNPLHALALIDDLSLHSSIFTCDVDPPRHDALSTAQILQRVQERFREDEMLWLAAATSPFRNCVVRRRKEESAVSVVLSDGLKVSDSQ